MMEVIEMARCPDGRWRRVVDYRKRDPDRDFFRRELEDEIAAMHAANGEVENVETGRAPQGSLDPLKRRWRKQRS